MDDLQIPFVLDLGTDSIKAGLAHESELINLPDLIIQNAIGYYNGKFTLYSHKIYNDTVFGQEIYDNISYYDVIKPMNNGFIENFDEEIKILDYIFKNCLQKKFNSSIEEHPLLLCLPINIPNKYINELYEMLFEFFNIPKIQIAPLPYLTLISQGLTSGVVVDSGECHTDIVPIFDNEVLLSNTFHSNFGGYNITDTLYYSFHRHFYHHNTEELTICKKIKEKFCYVSNNIELDRKISNETVSNDDFFKLKNDDIIKIKDEKFEVPEIMFTKKFDELEGRGIHQCIYDTIMNTKEDYHETFLSEIVISGSNTKFPGFCSRLQKEIENLVYTNQEEEEEDIEVYIDENVINNYHHSFDGGCILANLSIDKPENWVTYEAYMSLGQSFIINNN